MDEFARLLMLLVVAGAALTLLGGLVIWYSDEERRVRRGLRHVLKADPHALLVARGRGRGVGFNFATNMMAVAWDSGAWCLIYRIEELVGAELVIDGAVAGRAYRGEARRAVDLFGAAERQVRLRLIFDDPAHPDFDLDLWLAGDETRRKSISPQEAVQEANRWLARTESLLRRLGPAKGSGVLPISNAEAATIAARSRAAETPKPRAVAPAPARPPIPPVDELPFAPIDEDLPWDDDEDEDAPAKRAAD